MKKCPPEILKDPFAHIQREVPLFPEIIGPGLLSGARESSALWLYYLYARNLYEEIEHGIVYEGEKDPEPKFKELITSIAKLYDVKPEDMTNAWDEVDMVCIAKNLPTMPRDDKYRFDKPAIITSIDGYV